MASSSERVLLILRTILRSFWFLRNWNVFQNKIKKVDVLEVYIKYTIVYNYIIYILYQLVIYYINDWYTMCILNINQVTNNKILKIYILILLINSFIYYYLYLIIKYYNINLLIIYNKLLLMVYYSKY